MPQYLIESNSNLITNFLFLLFFFSTVLDPGDRKVSMEERNFATRSEAHDRYPPPRPDRVIILISVNLTPSSNFSRLHAYLPVS